MPSYVTNRGKFEIANLDADAADLRIILVNTPPASQAAAEDFNFVSDVVANEVANAQRANGDLVGLALTEDDTNNRAALDATDPTTYTGLNGPTIAGAWLFRRVGTDATDPLWAFLDVADIVTNGGDVTLSFATTGILTIT